MTKLTRDDIFTIRSNKHEPGKFGNSDGKFTCTIHGYVKPEYTVDGKGLMFMLALSRQDTILECKDWIAKENKEQGHWVKNSHVNTTLRKSVKPEYYKILGV